LENAISPEQLLDLEKSGLNTETIRASGIHSVVPGDINSILRVNGNIRSLMAIPYPGTNFTRYKLFPPCRLSPKDEKPRKYYQPPGSPICLYTPPGFDPKSPVIRITEGEKKSLRGCQEDLNVCGLGGIWNFASKDDNDRPQLIDGLASISWEGKEVELIPDGDFQMNPSVCHAVYRLASMLKKEGAKVKIVRLPANSKLDDYLCTHPIEAFCQLELLDLDNRIFRGAQIKEDGLGVAIRSAILGLGNFLDLNIERRPYILKPILRPGTLGMIYSPPGYGKTMFTLALAIAATYSVPVGEWETETAVKTLYIDAEMASDDLQERLRSLTLGLHSPDSPLHVWSSDYAEREGWPRPVLTNKEYRQAIYDFVSQEKYGLVMLDNKAALAPGIDESSKKDWDDINQWLLSLRFLGIAVILLHHAGKSGAQRGTSGVEDSLDFILKLEHPSDYQEEDGCDIDVSFQKARSIFGPDAAPFNFKLVKTPMGDGLTWVVTPKEAKKDVSIIAMLGNGATVTEVGISMKVTKGYVSRVKSKAINDGYLEVDDEKKRKVVFTAAGRREFGGVEI
jgi:hypothetical protein